MKLIIINKLSPEKQKEFETFIPGLSVEWYLSPEEALPHVHDADIIALWGFQNVEPLLQAAPQVKWIHSLSDGVERLLSPSMLNRSILLTNSRGVHDIAVAEHTIALLLALTRSIPTTIRQQEQHIWKRPRAFLLHGKTIAIIGYGNIGRAIAKRLQGFNCHIIAVKNHHTKEDGVNEIYTTNEINQVLPKADVTIAALPSTPETDQFFDSEKFNLMKENSYFINIARASIVNEKDLLAALTSGHLSGAGLDVFNKEPLPYEHPFWAMKQVIITPHVASWTPDTWQRLLELLKSNLKAFYESKPLKNIVDKGKGY